MKEPCRAGIPISIVFRALNAKMIESNEYEMIDVDDVTTDMSENHRHQFVLKLNEGLSIPIFSYYWSWVGSRAVITPHVI